MFLSDEFWSQFAPDRGPGSPLWLAAPALIVFVLPLVAVLVGTLVEWAAGPRES